MTTEPPALTQTDRLRADVRQALRDAGIRQITAARELRVSQKHVSQLFTGKVDFTLDWAERLAGLAGMRVRVDLEPDPAAREFELFAGGLA